MKAWLSQGKNIAAVGIVGVGLTVLAVGVSRNAMSVKDEFEPKMGSMEEARARAVVPSVPKNDLADAEAQAIAMFGDDKATPSAATSPTPTTSSTTQESGAVVPPAPSNPNDSTSPSGAIAPRAPDVAPVSASQGAGIGPGGIPLAPAGDIRSGQGEVSAASKEAQGAPQTTMEVFQPPPGATGKRGELQAVAFDQVNAWRAGQPAPVGMPESVALTDGTQSSAIGADDEDAILVAMASDTMSKVKGARSTSTSGQKILAGTRALCRLEDTLKVLPGEEQDTSVTCMGSFDQDNFPGQVRIIGKASLNKNEHRVEIKFDRCVLPARNNNIALDCKGSVRDLRGRVGLEGVIEDPGVMKILIEGATRIVAAAGYAAVFEAGGMALSKAGTSAVADALSDSIRGLGGEINRSLDRQGRSIEISGNSWVLVFFPESSAQW